MIPRPVRFACLGDGCCCRARDGYGYVYLTLEDRRRLAAHLGLTTGQFTRRYTAVTHGFRHLRHPDRDCGFLKGGRCSVYPARPLQCRAWPFWPENMDPGTWRERVAPRCPGVGRGRLYSEEEIRAILAEQEAAADLP